MGINKKSIKKINKRLLAFFLPLVPPKCIIVGAQKCGTTSLHDYLSQHPQILGSRPKEVDFFSNDVNYPRGQGWYHQSFINYKNPFKRLVSIEATPEYLYYDFVPKRIYNYNHNIKIIILLRDPVARCYSAWNMFKYFKERPEGIPAQLTSYENPYRQEFNALFSSNDFPTFEECIVHELEQLSENIVIGEPSFLRRGIYFEQVKNYVDLFGKKNVMVVGFNELTSKSKLETLNKILEFIGLRPSNWHFIEDKKRNSRMYNNVMKEETKIRLNEFYYPYNEKLFQYIGKKIDW